MREPTATDSFSLSRWNVQMALSPGCLMVMALVIRQIPRRLWDAVLLEIFGRGDDQPSALPDLARGEGRIAQRTHAQDDVDALLDKIHVPVLHHHVELERGVIAHERTEARDHVQSAEGYGHADAQPSGERRAGAAGSQFCLADLLDRASGVRIVVLPGFGRRESPVDRTSNLTPRRCSDLAKFPNVQRWYDMMMERRAVSNAVSKVDAFVPAG